MDITVKHRGNFDKTERHLNRRRESRYLELLHRYGKQGVSQLSAATPVDSGKSADSWNYEITRSRKGLTLTWTNSNLTSGGTPVVILIQYGHGTRGGGYVTGTDFINPALKSIINNISEDLWKEVRSG